MARRADNAAATLTQPVPWMSSAHSIPYVHLHVTSAARCDMLQCARHGVTSNAQLMPMHMHMRMPLPLKHNTFERYFSNNRAAFSLEKSIRADMRASINISIMCAQGQQQHHITQHGHHVHARMRCVTFELNEHFGPSEHNMETYTCTSLDQRCGQCAETPRCRALSSSAYHPSHAIPCHAMPCSPFSHSLYKFIYDC